MYPATVVEQQRDGGENGDGIENDLNRDVGITDFRVGEKREKNHLVRDEREEDEDRDEDV
jgi:hypothetical protein